jgi:orotate phosphoribosyltransferase
MKELGIELHYLATWWDILEAAKESGHFDAKTLTEVESFLNDPSSWSAAHGGISEFSPVAKD